ncbi:MAG: nitrate reductase molybdenum cofactor assembly chaperone [Arenicellales bacterium]
MNAPHQNPLKYPLRAIAALLAYPEDDVQRNVDEVGALLVIRPELETGERRMLEEFMQWFGDEPLLEVQAAYVETFDRSKKVSLYLFEHVYGESRDRGPAMVELREAYREQGLEIDGRELPDFLPIFLEFCSELPEAQARSWLAEVGEIVQQVHVRLHDRGSRYAVPLRVLLRIIGLDPMPEAIVDTAASEERDDTPAALDRVWAEVPVIFGPGQEHTHCGATRQYREQSVQWVENPRTGGKPRSA